MIALAALAALVVVLLAAIALVGATLKRTFRAIERKDVALDRMRQDSMERFAFLVGKNMEPTPREAAQGRENDLYQAEREMLMARVVADPEQMVDYPSPGEARHREKAIGARYELGDLDAEARELLGDLREPVFVDIEADATV